MHFIYGFCSRNFTASSENIRIGSQILYRHCSGKLFHVCYNVFYFVFTGFKNVWIDDWCRKELCGPTEVRLTWHIPICIFGSIDHYGLFEVEVSKGFYMCVLYHRINVYAFFVTLLPLNRVWSLMGAVKAIVILFCPFLKFVWNLSNYHIGRECCGMKKIS